MNGIEYRSAALKHLCACKTLLTSQEFADGDNYVVCTLFYLSGYICESIINYAIYNICGMLHEEVGLLNHSGCSFNDPTSRFRISNHRYISNINFIYRERIGFDTKVEALITKYEARLPFEKWRPHYRYSIDHQFANASKARDYIEFCEQFYILTLKSL